MDSRFLSYLALFEKGEYFLCHEYGESLWLDSGRPIALKGFIQAAVCLYHMENGNVRGAYAMWLRAKGYLDPYRPVSWTVDVDRLVRDIDAVFARVPVEWREKVLAPADILALRLPKVSIYSTVAEIRQQLTSWLPEPLSGRGEAL